MIPPLGGIFLFSEGIQILLSFIVINQMNQVEQEQILSIIKNLQEKRNAIPFFSDLANNPTFGPVFTALDAKQKAEVEALINTYITETAEWFTKTKGGQLFKRFFDASPELFWEFRALNEDPSKHQKKFQEVGKQVEQEMFRLEGILTEKMIDQEKGLDKVIGSFYNIVYMFFPKMGEVGGDE